jgi:pyrimidine-nucleoside phosphorylase
MRMYDIIRKKRDGAPLPQKEIEFFVKHFTSGAIPDYQAAALLMAVFFCGMNKTETVQLTDAMARSGEMLDLSAIPGIKVDKHSTGGVGDKTTLIVAPIVAACGVPVAKMSGRGLGHTGGTIDKLEAIPGFCTALSKKEFIAQVQNIGLAIAGQTGQLAPADKKIYALRDVTATVDEPSLIAASIMSKKLAAGAQAIVLDVKTGSGAFMQTLEESVALGEIMVEIGTMTGRNTIAYITNMDRPLGHAVGNALEVAEAVEVLQGHGASDLIEISTRLAAGMLFLANHGAMEACRKKAENALNSGAAFEKFCQMVAAQGGDIAFLKAPHLLPRAPARQILFAKESGCFSAVDALACGRAAVELGAGRTQKDAPIDFGAGLWLHKQIGDAVKQNEPLITVYAPTEAACRRGLQILDNAVEIAPERPAQKPLFLAQITAEGTVFF